MKERPIIMSAPMVRALLDGSKTQTRRAVKPQPTWHNTHHPTMIGDKAVFGVISDNYPQSDWKCPYGHPGDRLWVREGFKPIASGEVKNGYGEVRYGYAYKADGATNWAARPTIIHDLTSQPDTGPKQFTPRPWKPSIHMPRRASRILLEITDVRVERLQDITPRDAIAEGVEGNGRNTANGWRMGYRDLWESINGAGSWDANPWVWVVEFRRIGHVVV